MSPQAAPSTPCANSAPAEVEPLRTVDLKPYPVMKDSGVEWLGEVPEHWEVRRTRYLLSEVDQRSTTGEETHLSMSQRLGLVPSEKVQKTLVSESYIGGKLCRQEDLVLNRLKAHLGVFALARQSGVISPDYSVFQRKCSLSMAYVERTLRSPACRGELGTRAKGIVEGFWRLYTDDFFDIRLPLPPLPEQTAIVCYLNHVDRQVRRFVQAKQKLIKLLEEEKQALIHRAVTRGLDPDVPMKDSGVEWLGEVPEHWEVKRLKWVTRLQRGYDLPAGSRVAGPFPVVSSGGVIDTHHECRSSGPGVVMGRYGSTDAVFYLDHDFWPHNTSLFVTDFQGNLPKWCFYLLRSISKADHSGKSAVPGLDRKDLFQILVAVPPRSEQEQIVKSLERSFHDIQEAITRARREIALLHEYRTRLIADVVTGKLDVRQAAAGLPEEVSLLGEDAGGSDRGDRLEN